MTMKPLADRVLIKVEKEQEEKTAGGLVLATKNPATLPSNPFIPNLATAGFTEMVGYQFRMQTDSGKKSENPDGSHRSGAARLLRKA